MNANKCACRTLSFASIRVHSRSCFSFGFRHSDFGFSMHIDRAILKQCWFLAGPTAAGKTAAGLALAERIGGEIVALDSMTLYRGMDIGTAKPTADERAR